ncbi:MAG: hypothetical protein QOD83_3100 [Solirubrobacteraceae bacterium]|jgi:hypothetical protein|nr:hypothetical protein [Solirubrobacteraceae bacterium]
MPDRPQGSRKLPHTFWDGAGGPIIAGVIAVVGGLVGIFVGNTGVAREQLPGSPVQTVTSTALRTVTVTTPGDPGSDAPNATTSGYAVRRTTGTHPITLRFGYSVDLDSKLTDWDIGYAEVADRFDLGFDSTGLSGDGKGDVGLVTGPKRAETCAYATGYGGVDMDKLRKGLTLCARSSDGRHAYLTVTAFDIDVRDSITLAATVWDPPAEGG